MNLITFIIIFILSYFLGAIPFGYIYSMLRGVDIRKVGSGNIGSTNVSRQFGFWGGFVPVFILDFLKGLIPVLLIRIFGVENFSREIAMFLVGMAAIMGHLFPVYLHFKGGKGVATSAGVFIVLLPLECLSSLGIFIISLFIINAVRVFSSGKPFSIRDIFKDFSKILWISSILAALTLPVFVVFEGAFTPFKFIIGLLLALLIIMSHRKNIQKAVKGGI